MSSRPSALLVVIVATVALSLSADRSPRPGGYISEAGHMLAPRSGHTATLLSDGRVLIAGGMVRNHEFLDSAEIYDPAKGSFRRTGSMTSHRVGHSAALLGDGRVLIVGGWVGGTTDRAEIYDPKTERFTAVGSMHHRRAGATATALIDGRVLITGGGSDEDRIGQKSAELFDPVTEKFLELPNMQDARTEHTATLLKDGTVLVAGGMADNRVTASAETFDPKTNRFSLVKSMLLSRYKHTSQLLGDGRVLIAGGADDRDWKGTLAEAELYDPATRSFKATSSMLAKRFKLDHQSALLPDGSVLIAGGGERAEVFDPRRARFDQLASGTGTPQWFMTETSLKDGQVLLLGGYSTDMTATNRAWMYRP